VKIKYELKKFLGINGILALALVLSTFTQVRFSGLPIGFSDLFFLSYIIYSIGLFSLSLNDINSSMARHEVRAQIRPISFYLLFFLFLIFIGTLYCNFLILQGDIEVSLNSDGANLLLSPYHNILAYSYLAIIFFTLYIRSDIDPSRVAFYTSILLSLCVAIFYLFSVFVGEIFGINLYYNVTNRMMLFTKSPNHLADFIAPLPIFLIYFYTNTQSVLLRLFLIILSIFILLAIFESQSKAAILGLSLAFLYLLWRFISQIITLRYVFILVVLLILSLFLYINKFHSESILNLTQNIYESGTIDISTPLFYDLRIRLGLVFHAIDVGNISPIFGLGAGASTGINDIFMGRESHNHLTEIFMSTGYLGLASYVGLMLFVYAKIHRTNKPILVGAFIVITIVSMFHVQLRQPLFWFNIVFLLYFASYEISNLTNNNKD
jgi:hypothetical protein